MSKTDNNNRDDLRDKRLQDQDKLLRRRLTQGPGKLTKPQEEYAKDLQESREEINDHKRGMAERAEDGNDLLNRIDDIILKGLEIRLELLQYATVSNQTTVKMPAGRAGREFTTRCRVWLDRVEACVTRWRKHRWGYLQEYIVNFNCTVAFCGGGGAGHIGRSPFWSLEQILDELRGIIPQLEIMNFNAEQRIRQQLTGDELNHAEQLLEIEGQYEEAILRAAGVIAGVVLENHLADVVHQQNAKIPEEEDQYSFGGTNSIDKYSTWLIKQEIIPRTENVPLTNLNFIRNCCDHAPGGKLRAPTREETEQLIRDTRKYVRDISVEPETTQ